MSDNTRYVFAFDAQGQVSAVSEVQQDASLQQKSIEDEDSFAMAGNYVVWIETEDDIEYEVFALDAATGTWFEFSQGHGTPNLDAIAALTAGAAPAVGSDDDDEDDDEDDEGDNEDGDDLYQFVLDGAGTTVIAMYEVKDDGSLEDEGLSDNETHTVVGDYIVEVEQDDDGQDWSIYLLDAATGFHAKVAEGEGPITLTETALDALVAAYVPGSDDDLDDDDYFDGDDGDDDFEGAEGDDGDDHYAGGSGHDTVTYMGATNTQVDLSVSGSQDTGHGHDSFTGIEGVHSGGGDDDLDGDDGDNDFDSDAGDDSVDGHGGDDSISCGDGDDDAEGDGGDDDLNGGGGSDTLDGGAGNDTEQGGMGNDTLKGGRGNDDMDGGEDDDFLAGGNNSDTVDGGMGDDRLAGNRGDDDMEGGDGDDTLIAGRHDDTLCGGEGDDDLYGGNGADVFVFDLGFDIDEIHDFNVANDVLQISAALANGMSAADIAAGAVVTADGLLIDFGNGDVIELDDVTSAIGLEAAIQIV